MCTKTDSRYTVMAGTGGSGVIMFERGTDVLLDIQNEDIEKTG